MRQSVDQLHKPTCPFNFFYFGYEQSEPPLPPSTRSLSRRTNIQPLHPKLKHIPPRITPRHIEIQTPALTIFEINFYGEEFALAFGALLFGVVSVAPLPLVVVRFRLPYRFRKDTPIRADNAGPAAGEVLLAILLVRCLGGG